MSRRALLGQLDEGGNNGIDTMFQPREPPFYRSHTGLPHAYLYGTAGDLGYARIANQAREDHPINPMPRANSFESARTGEPILWTSID